LKYYQVKGNRAMSLSEELGKLEELHNRGALTEEEFERAKARLLDGPSGMGRIPLVNALNALRRSRSDRWIAGVCGGIAHATGAESWLWRLLFAVFFFFGGAGLLLYVLLWIFVPVE
jgi:phage shock protein C